MTQSNIKHRIMSFELLSATSLRELRHNKGFASTREIHATIAGLLDDYAAIQEVVQLEAKEAAEREKEAAKREEAAGEKYVQC